jgi:hypothetical protein
MVLSVTTTAFAAWPVYNGNDDHNGQITTGVPNIGLTPVNSTAVPLPNNGSGWDGVDTQTVMRTVDGTTYAYVIYDGYTTSSITQDGGTRIAKINCNTNTVVWSKRVGLNPGFQLSTPLLVEAPREADDVLYVGVNGYSQILVNDGLNPNAVPAGWTVTGSGVTWQSNYVEITGTNSATLTQAGITLDPSQTNRAAVGISVNDPDGDEVQIEVLVAIDGRVQVQNTFPNTDQPKPIGGSYYLNENFTSGLSGGNYSVVVNVLANTSGSPVDVDYAQLYQQSGSIQKVTGLNADDGDDVSSVSIVTGITGQINTPITSYSYTDSQRVTHNCIYFGTWGGGGYYQVDLANPSSPAIFTSSYGGFYWAGAYSDGNFVYFGGDGGYLYYVPVDGFEDTASASNSMALSGGGNVRSSISTDGTNLYFTNQSGYLWKATKAVPGTPITPPNLTSVSLPSTSTSTPALSENGYIYVGYYSGFSSGGVAAIPLGSFTQASLVDVYGNGVSGTGTAGDPVQCSPIVYTDVETTFADYVYFTTNSDAGAGYCYEFDGSAPGTQIWTAAETSSNRYALQGYSSDNGYLVYGDDGDNLYIVSP